VPVIWTRNGKEMVVLASAVTFADSQLAATTAREIGPEVIAAELYAPPDSWLDYAGPQADRRLLWLATNVLPALDVDAEAKQRVMPRSSRSITTSPTQWRCRSRSPTTTWSCASSRAAGFRDATNPESYAYEEWFSRTALAQARPGELRLSAAKLRGSHPQLSRSPRSRRSPRARRRSLEHGKSQHPGRGWEGATVNVIATGFAWPRSTSPTSATTSSRVRSHDGDWTLPKRRRAPRRASRGSNDAFYRMLLAFGNQADLHPHD